MAPLLQHKEWQVTKNTKTHVHVVNILSPIDQGEPDVPGAPEDENKEDIDGERNSTIKTQLMEPNINMYV